MAKAQKPLTIAGRGKFALFALTLGASVAQADGPSVGGTYHLKDLGTGDTQIAVMCGLHDLHSSIIQR